MVRNEINKADYIRYADLMVSRQIKARGITEPRLLEIMKKIPRHLFVKGFDMDRAYRDSPLPIGFSQTISQPYMVAYMTSQLYLTGHEKILEIGTGSGYQTCILSELGREVYTIERIKSLFEKAKHLLDSLGYMNICYLNGDGSSGWEEYAPYDRIIVTAALPSVPDILKSQLADNGILLAPVGNYQTYQVLLKIQRIGNRFDSMEDIKCRFVPVIGEYGF